MKKPVLQPETGRFMPRKSPFRMLKRAVPQHRTARFTTRKIHVKTDDTLNCYKYSNNISFQILYQTHIKE